MIHLLDAEHFRRRHANTTCLRHDVLLVGAQSAMLGGGGLDLPRERRAQMLGMLGRVNASLAETSARYGVPPLQITDLLSYAAALNIVFVAPDFQPCASKAT